MYVCSKNRSTLKKVLPCASQKIVHTHPEFSRSQITNLHQFATMHLRRAVPDWSLAPEILSEALRDYSGLMSMSILGLRSKSTRKDCRRGHNAGQVVEGSALENEVRACDLVFNESVQGSVNVCGSSLDILRLNLRESRFKMLVQKPVVLSMSVSVCRIAIRAVGYRPVTTVGEVHPGVEWQEHSIARLAKCELGRSAMGLAKAVRTPLPRTLPTAWQTCQTNLAFLMTILTIVIKM